MTGTNSLILPVFFLVCGIAIFLLGVTLLRVGRASPPTRAAALMLFFAGLGPLLTASGLILQQSLSEGSVLFTSMLENFEYLWEFYFPSLLLFTMTFPRERLVLQRFPAIGLLLFLPYILHLMAFMFGERMLEHLTNLPGAILGDRDHAASSAISGFDAVVGALVRVLERVHRGMFALVNVVYAVFALDLLWRSQHGLPNRRLIRQMRTVGIGIAASLACYALAKLSLMTGARMLSASRSQALLSLSLVASGGTIAYAVIRQQFLGVRHVLQRALMYGVLATGLGALYLLAVRPVTAFFSQYSTVGQHAFEAGFVVLVVLAFQPVTERAESMLELALARGSGSTPRRAMRSPRQERMKHSTTRSCAACAMRWTQPTCVLPCSRMRVIRSPGLWPRSASPCGVPSSCAPTSPLVLEDGSWGAAARRQRSPRRGPRSMQGSCRRALIFSCR
jgi:hypothetical protein